MLTASLPSQVLISPLLVHWPDLKCQCPITPFSGPNPFKRQIGDRQSTDLKSAAAGKNRAASRRSNQSSLPVCPSLRTCLSPFSIPDHPGRLSSSRTPPRGSDAPECKRRCCFSRAHPAPSSMQDTSFRVSQRAYPYSLGSGPQGFPAFLGLRDKSAIHTPSLILSSRHLLFSSHSDSRLRHVETPSAPLCQPVITPTVELWYRIRVSGRAGRAYRGDALHSHGAHAAESCGVSPDRPSVPDGNDVCTAGQDHNRGQFALAAFVESRNTIVTSWAVSIG